jgi:1,4-alpha-glucan branching enzyme
MGFQWLAADDAEQSVYAFLRWADGGNHAVACATNFTPVPRGGHRVGLPWAGTWDIVVDTDAVQFGGSGFNGWRTSTVAEDVPWQGQPCSALVDLPPLGALWLAKHRP